MKARIHRRGRLPRVVVLYPATCALCALLCAAPATAQDEPIQPEEEFAEEEEPPPDRPAPQGKGVVWGTVLDERGEPLIEVQVTVKGTNQQTFTDFDGRYRLELPPGTYTVEFWFSGFKPTELRGIEVTAGRVLALDEKLEPEAGGVDVIEVEEKADTASVEGQLLTRKRSANVGDAIGRAEMSKSGDKSAADSARRVVGVYIDDDRFIFVRGLGERYVNASLDGAPLPSPEPERRAVPFDLFPNLMLESLTITKTFTPDMPGDFAGGSVGIATRRLPDAFTVSAGLSLGINSHATFREGLTYRGSSTDFLGIDGGTRALPKEIPDHAIGRGFKNPDGTFQTREQRTAWGQAINAYMSSQRAIIPPDHGGSFVIGNTFDLGGGQKFGAMGALSYSRSYELRRGETFTDYSEAGAAPQVLEEESTTDKVRWGGLAGVTYAPDKHSRFHLTGLHSRSAEDKTREIEGYRQEVTARVHETRLEFVSRALTFGQLRAEHDLEDLNKARFEWYGFAALAERDQPDTRATVFQLDSAQGFAYEDASESGYHFFSEQRETTYGGGFDWTQPLTPDEQTKLKWGSSFSLRAREFSARRFRFKPLEDLVCPVPAWDATCPDQMFARENIGTSLEIEEGTRADDAYEADLNVFAAYVMGDVALTDDVRLIAGPRVEASHHTMRSHDPFSADVAAVEVEKDFVSILPGVALIYSITDDVNLRLAGSRTLARPQLREIAPFTSTNHFGARPTRGNPDLDETRIWNADLRFEWFPTPAEVLATSVFYKRFIDPIETIVLPQGNSGVETYANADSATLFGFELETRKSLDFIHEAVEDFSIIVNVTLARSRIELTDEQAGIATSRNRPLAQQAPYSINAELDYTNEDIGFSARLLYNVVGSHIVTVGTKGLPDRYLQPRHLLDAVIAQELFKGFELKLTGKNLLNSEFLEQEAGEPAHSYRKGIGVSLGATYTY